MKNQCHTILLVEDEANIRKSMAMILESQGYNVSTAVHGMDALCQVESSVPDMVISDLNMPEMSGFELLAIIRQRYPSVRLIAVSGIYDPGGLAPAGVVADAFYPKGRGRPETLLSAIADLIATLPAQSGVKA